MLLFGHGFTGGAALFTGMAQVVAGVAAGFGIGVVAALLGVAGGELLIPTLVLLFGADIKLAGSLSLAVSLPTMLVGFTRYSRDQSFAVIGRNRLFLLTMAAGSIVGTFIGGQLLGLVPSGALLPAAGPDPADFGGEGLAAFLERRRLLPSAPPARAFRCHPVRNGLWALVQVVVVPCPAGGRPARGRPAGDRRGSIQGSGRRSAADDHRRPGGVGVDGDAGGPRYSKRLEDCGRPAGAARP